MKTPFAIAAAAAAGLSLVQPALGQSDGNKLGTVHFETSCKPEAQKLFDEGCCISTRSGTAHRNKPSRMC